MAMPPLQPGYGTHLQPSAAVYRPGFSQQYAPGAPHLPAMQAPVPPAGARCRSTSPQPGSPPSPTLPLMARTGPQATPPAEVDFRPGVSFGNTSYMQYAPEVENGFTDAELRAIYGKLDKNRNGIVSKLELIAAVSQEKSIADMLGIDGESLLSDEKSFDELHSLFEEISAGKKGIDFEAFAKHVRKACAERTPRSNRMLEIFNLIDADNSGSISKLELVAAMQNNPSVDEFLMPGVDSSRIMDDENLFEKIDGLFEAIAGGKKRFTYSDFEKYFRKAVVAATPRPPSNQNRSSTRVFIIGPGFGNQINPRQSRMVEAAGYQMRFCFSIPNPEVPHFPVDPYLEQVKSEMDAFRPHVVMGASKGGVYIIGLWRRGYWRGPTVLINAHPTCRQLPQEANVVIAVGSNDEVYPIQRPELEEIMKTGGMNKTFLYFTADSGRLPSGQISRQGDTHNQESLLHHDVLPRLIDSVLCPEGPEMHFIRTWKERLSVERNNAELWLGFSPEQVMRLWSTNGHGQHLFDVHPGTEEYRMVTAAFKALPVEQQAYILSPPETWLPVRALRIQRVENGPQGDASWKPYYKSLVRSLEDQGVEFEPGTHTCWAFHGCNNEALESIINNPLSGFQPLASGSRSTTLWGSGTYFARDAKYVADGGFCGTPDMNGSRRMLMCLLIMGMPCLGDPTHKGVLPFRHKPPHRYHSSVDCLASPEVMVIQQSGAAMPAYVITFA